MYVVLTVVNPMLRVMLFQHEGLDHSACLEAATKRLCGTINSLLPHGQCSGKSNQVQLHTQDCTEGCSLPRTQAAEAMFCKTEKDVGSRHCGAASSSIVYVLCFAHPAALARTCCCCSLVQNLLLLLGSVVSSHDLAGMLYVHVKVDMRCRTS